MITNEKIIWSFEIHLYEMKGDQSSGRSDLQMRGRGVIQTLRWGGGIIKNFVASVWSTIKGGGAGPSLGSATAISLEVLYVDFQGA